MLELVKVSKKYKSEYAVREVSFSLEKGEILGLLGGNGAGKSTIISMIATLQKPDSGQILFHGKDIKKYPYLIRESLGYVPQDNILYENLSGMDNLLFWGRSYHLDAERLKLEIKRVCDIIGLDKGALEKKASQYSGGMKKRLNVGVALLHRPELILLDEPTAGIDVQSARQLTDGIRALSGDDTAIIYVGHDLNEAQQLCSRVCFMREGVLTADIKLSETDKALSSLYEELNNG